MRGTATLDASRKLKRKGQTVAAAFLFLLSAAYGPPLRAAAKATFLYNLSTFTGPIPYNAPRIVVDRERNEVSVLSENEVQVFNEQGMEVYRFGEDLDVGIISDLSVEGNGDIMLLAYSLPPESRYGVFRCNFRGELAGRVEIKNLPPQLSDFSPNRLFSVKETLYLADLWRLKVVQTDRDGAFKNEYDIFQMLSLEKVTRDDVGGITGFTVADDGSMLFTIPTLFSAYRLYPDGKMVAFGKPGSAPGKFNLIRGIALDSRGNYLVVDRLKSTVMVFDAAFTYVTQFGFRGFGKGNLIAPDEVAVDRSGKVYVTQNLRRGVSVYAMRYEEGP